MPLLDLHAHYPMHFPLPSGGKWPTEAPSGKELEFWAANMLFNFQAGAPRVSLDHLMHGEPGGIVSVLHDPEDEFFHGTTPVPEAFDHLLKQLDTVEKSLIGQPVVIARNPATVRACLDSGQRFLLHAAEGAFGLGGDENNVDTLAKAGVAYLTIAHLFYRGVAAVENGLPFVPDALFFALLNPKQPLGLSELGERIVRRCMANRILVDVTHCTAVGRNSILKIARDEFEGAPVIASHTGVQSTSPYGLNLDTEAIKAIAQSGGVIGVILSKYWLRRPEQQLDPSAQGGIGLVLDAIQAIFDCLGDYDHIAIGTDLDGFIDPVRGCENFAETPQLARAITDAQFRRDQLVTGVHKRFPEAADKILYKNALRVLEYWQGVPGPKPAPREVLTFASSTTQVRINEDTSVLRRITDFALSLQKSLETIPPGKRTALTRDVANRLVDLDQSLRRWRTEAPRLPPAKREGPGEFAGVLAQLHRYCPGLAAMMQLPEPSEPLPQIRAALLEGPRDLLVSNTGDIYHLAKFEQGDLGWLLSALNYFATLWGFAPTEPFKNSDPKVITATASQVKIAIVGDWGTGYWQDGDAVCPASQIGQIIRSWTDVDFVIHLGDVYYSGEIDEEVGSMEDIAFPTGKLGTLMLNSNHEMYSGARGYFHALDPRHTGKKFVCQNGNSFFAIETADCIVIGLDSAYFDTSFLCERGALSDDNQKAFVREQMAKGKRTVLLTHHNGLKLDGQPTDLWEDMVKLFAPKLPDYWYWGHLHQTVYYKKISAWGGVTARCAGSGGLPVAAAAILDNSPIVDFYSSVKADPGVQDADLRIMNSFSVITIASGKPLVEEVFTQDGNRRWRS